MRKSYKSRTYSGSVRVNGKDVLVGDRNRTAIVADLSYAGVNDRMATVDVTGVNVRVSFTGLLEASVGNPAPVNGYPPSIKIGGADIVPLLAQWGQKQLEIKVTELL
jgi:hypothetical protein